MNNSNLTMYHFDTVEPAVRVCQSSTVERQYCSLLLSLRYDSTTANVIWALLHDQADVVWSKTSSRRIAANLGIDPRTTARVLTQLLDSGLLKTSGRSYFDIRYRLETETLLKQWIQIDALPDCFESKEQLAVLCESWGFDFENRSPSIILFCQLTYDYPRFAVLSALIHFIQDDDGIVSVSCRSLAETASLPSMTVHRKLLALEEQGLIERLDSSSRTASFHVCLDVLRALLAAPLPEVDVLPGITPLPALQRLFPVTHTTGGSQ